MLVEERRDRICEIIRNTGAVETAKLAELFHVSIETIRKDLLFLEKSDKLLKTHGGAVIKGEMKPMYALTKRCEEYSREKHALATAAMELISEGDIIGIDEGSTAIAFAEVLKERFSKLTIVTHSLDVFNRLAHHKDFHMILCGGNYMKEERAFCGSQTLEALRNLHIQKAFIFPTAISLAFGICGYIDDLLQVQRQLIQSASKTYILADSSKFEKQALLKLCDINPDFFYITDDKLDADIQSIYREKHLTLYTG